MEEPSQTNYRNARTAAQEFGSPIQMVVKMAYDTKINPYFNFGRNHFNMPEAITYMLKNAEKQIAACGDADKWIEARVAETVDVPFEEDENIKPEVAHAQGFEPKQLVYMKAAQEYYLAHVSFCGSQRKCFQELQQTNFGVNDISKLAKNIPSSFWQNCSFEEAHYKGQTDAVSLLE